MVVDVEDIFDEFSFGAYDPQALRAFLVDDDTALGSALLDMCCWLETLRLTRVITLVGRVKATLFRG